MLKLLPTSPWINGVKNVKGSVARTVTVLPRPLPPTALEQAIVVPVVSLQVTVGADTLPAPTWDWALVSWRMCVWIPVVSVGFVAAYAAPSRTALLISMYE